MEQNAQNNYKSKFGQKLDSLFEISARKSTISTEIIAGLTTFFAMCYIVLVNPDQVAAGGAGGWLAGLIAPFAGELGAIWNAVFIGSIISAAIGTLLMAFLAKMPFAQACGMGLNSFFCTCFVSGAAFGGATPTAGYQAGLVIILLSGILFLVLSVTGAREYIAKALPDCLKKAIPAGIGLFIAFIGFKNSGIVVADRWTFVGLVDLRNWAYAAPALAAFLGLIAIVVLSSFKNSANKVMNVLSKGAVILGILISTILYYIFTATAPNFDNASSVGQAFSDFWNVGVMGIFNGESWANAFSAEFIGGIFSAITLVITFSLVDMFDTVGTLYGTAAQANMLDENGDPIRMNQSMLCDSIATCTGAVLGTSTVTTFVESSSGVAAGGRTGFASVITALCFLVCLFLSPVATVIPTVCTAPALIYVGVLMLSNFAKVDMSDITAAVPAFLTLIIMPLTYSIANGIGVGAIAYTLIKLLTGKFTKKDIVVAVIAAIFIARFALTFMGTYPVYAN